jgi:purine-binding chemotaxis protein CheW
MTTEKNTSISPKNGEAVNYRNVQLLTFLLDGEVYGADIIQVQEVLEYRKVTPVPRMPEFLLGVINLRGQVVAVVDLRRQFGMDVMDITVNTCIVIVDVQLEGESVALGLLADAVKEVIELEGNNICAPPRIGSRINAHFISGMGKHNDDFIIILDLPKVLADEDLNQAIETMSDAGSDHSS